MCFLQKFKSNTAEPEGLTHHSFCVGCMHLCGAEQRREQNTYYRTHVRGPMIAFVTMMNGWSILLSYIMTRTIRSFLLKISVL